MIYDVVIIGSGLGGLECAHILSKAGLSVLVLERQAQPGGCMQSYRRGGFSFDTGLHYVGGLAEGQSLHTIFEQLGLLDLPWQRLDTDGFDRITIGDQTYRFTEGFDHFAETLADYFPSERQALREYMLTLRGNEPEQMEVSAWDYLNRHFSDPLLVNVLSGSSLKMELNKETLPLFVFTHGNCSFVESSWRLRGDGNMLIERLVDGIRANGGEVVCNSEVVNIEEQEDHLLAARTANAQCFCGKYIVSDTHPALTCQLVKNMKPLYRRRVCSQPNTFGVFTASLVLKANALPYFNHNHFVYEQANVWDVPTTVDRVMVCCRVPEDGSKHTCQVDLLTPMPWQQCQPWANSTVGRRGDDYKAMKERTTHDCIRLAERVLPGLGQMVEACHTSTPLTYRDYTRTPEGSAYGMRKDYHYPMFTVISPRTPVPNLLLTGQSLMLHGVHGVSMTALHTCAELLGKDYIKAHYKIEI